MSQRITVIVGGEPRRAKVDTIRRPSKWDNRDFDTIEFTTVEPNDVQASVRLVDRGTAWEDGWGDEIGQALRAAYNLSDPVPEMFGAVVTSSVRPSQIGTARRHMTAMYTSSVPPSTAAGVAAHRKIEEP